MSPADVKFLDAMLSGQPLRREERLGQVTKAVDYPSTGECQFSQSRKARIFTPGGTRLKGFAFDLLSACYPHADRITSYREEQKKLSGHILRIGSSRATGQSAGCIPGQTAPVP